ncbi:hypothetical protein [Candidatus Nitrosocosmicus sp. R]
MSISKETKLKSMIEELEEKNNNENSVDRRLIAKDKEVEGLNLFLCKILSSTIMI